MKKMTALSQATSCAFVLGIIVLLPGCDMFKSGSDADSVAMKQKEISDQAMQQKMDNGDIAANDTSEVLLTVAGKPVMTVDSFEADFEEFIDANPQYKQMMAFGMNVKEQLFDGLSKNKIITHYIKDQKIDQLPEYKVQLEKGKKAVKMLIDDQFYKERLPVQVDESDIRAFYEKQKVENQQLTLSVGGVNARGVKFENEEDAKAFLDKVSVDLEQFESLVTSEDLANKETDFRMVSEYSPGLDAQLKQAIISVDSFPSVNIVKDADESFWVVYASEKEDKKYHPYEQIKAQLEEQVKREKTEEAVDSHLEGLKKQYGIAVNKDYFSKEEADKAAALEAIQEQMRMAMEQSSEVPSEQVAEQEDDMTACIA